MDLPEPLFVLSLKDYRNYEQIRGERFLLLSFSHLISRVAKYTENDFSFLRTKIGELHPVHRASLGALLRHLLRIASHSDINAMTVEELAAKFRYAVLRGLKFSPGGVHVKVHCIDF